LSASDRAVGPAVRRAHGCRAVPDPR
jgi:hypothetical protein